MEGGFSGAGLRCFLLLLLFSGAIQRFERIIPSNSCYISCAEIERCTFLLLLVEMVCVYSKYKIALEFLMKQCERNNRAIVRFKEATKKGGV